MNHCQWSNSSLSSNFKIHYSLLAVLETNPKASCELGKFSNTELSLSSVNQFCRNIATPTHLLSTPDSGWLQARHHAMKPKIFTTWSLQKKPIPDFLYERPFNYTLQDFYPIYWKLLDHGASCNPLAIFIWTWKFRLEHLCPEKKQKTNSYQISW